MTRHNGTYLNRDHTFLLLIYPFKYKFIPPSLGIQVDDLACGIPFRRLEVDGNFETLDKPSESFPFLLFLFSREGAGAAFLRRFEDKILKSERGPIQKLVAHLRQILPVAAPRVRL